MSFAESEMEPC